MPGENKEKNREYVKNLTPRVACAAFEIPVYSQTEERQGGTKE